jgi:predicted transglutaminase-like cysteine proteinase
MRVGLLAAALTISAQTICWAQTERVLRPIKFDAPTLAPMAYTLFCVRYLGECKARRPIFRGGRIRLTNERGCIGDLVLDNLTEVIMPWFQKPFQWVRIQTPCNPNFWVSVAQPDAARVIVRSPFLQRLRGSNRSGVI